MIDKRIRSENTTGVWFLVKSRKNQPKNKGTKGRRRGDVGRTRKNIMSCQVCNQWVWTLNKDPCIWKLSATGYTTCFPNFSYICQRTFNCPLFNFTLNAANANFFPCHSIFSLYGMYPPLILDQLITQTHCINFSNYMQLIDVYCPSLISLIAGVK